MRAFVLAAALVPFAAACGSSVNNESTPDGGALDATSDSAISATALPCDVEAILGRACGSCHGATPAFGAPNSLLTLSDLQKPAVTDPSKKVWEEVKRRVNLPADEPGRMPQKPNAPLASADLAALNTWLEAGMPARTGSCTNPDDAGPDDAPPVKPLSCTPDVKVRPASKWAMPKELRDEYVCYGFEYNPASKQHITGVAPAILNSKIVHHILLMQSDTPVDTKPFACAEGAIARYRMLYAWAPGVGSFELPPQAGLPAEPGKGHFVVQIHYNNVAGLEGESDDSGFDFCTTDTLRPNDADILAFGSMKFSIPAKSKLDITATWTIPSFVPEIHAIGAFPHMHQLGKRISTTLEPKAGGTIDLGTDNAFDFSNQFFAPLGDVTIKSGDTVKTRCVWENPTDRVVPFGENTENEMCYSFTMYYPKVSLSTWSWAAPAYLATTTTN